MIKKIAPLILLALLTFQAKASADGAWETLVRSKGNYKYYPKVAAGLINEGLYFTSIPYIKEFLSRGGARNNKDVDLLIDQVITQVGVRQFEVLPNAVLNRSNAPTIKYILAKKSFRKGDYQKALNYLNGTIPREHPSKPVALLLEGTIFSILKKPKSSVAAFKDCISESKTQMNRASSDNRLRQLAINRDYCTVGIARAEFAGKDFESANSSYLDLPKDSYVWPEILFEEAWNSFYLRDYNRTLGKLVTYNAPILNFIFNPETEVLKSLTYMELCLFDDAKKVVDDFYNKYQEDTLSVKKFLGKYGKDYKYYYLLAKSTLNGKRSGNRLLNTLMDNVLRDAAYRELVDSFNLGRDEIQKVKSMRSAKMRKVFSANLRESLLLQRDMIGAYVRKTLHLNMDHLDKSFEGMTYIKLEVLGRRKKQLYYSEQPFNRARGDVKYLKRSDKQYFWTFNGEFWADELGDYVFSLRSECE